MFGRMYRVKGGCGEVGEDVGSKGAQANHSKQIVQHTNHGSVFICKPRFFGSRKHNLTPFVHPLFRNLSRRVPVQ